MALFTYPALKAELQNDPATLGYAPLIASGAYNQVADKLNAIIPGSSIIMAWVRCCEVRGAVHRLDFEALTAAEKELLDFWTCNGGQEFIRVWEFGNKAAAASLYRWMQSKWEGGGNGTWNRIKAACDREGSRAEVLWGESVATDNKGGTHGQITVEDIAQALAS
jgi:hypothetical protein